MGIFQRSCCQVPAHVPQTETPPESVPFASIGHGARPAGVLSQTGKTVAPRHRGNFQRAFPQAQRGLRRGNALAQATEIRSHGRISTQRDATFTAKSHEASWCHEASSEASRSRAQGEHASAESSQCDPHVWRFLCINRSRYETSKTVARHPSSARSAGGRGKLSFDCGDGTSTSPAGGFCEDGDSRVLPETNFEEKYSH